MIARLASIAVGAMFVAAGTFKLADGAAWPRQAADLHVPAAIARIVPWFELALGVLLVLGVGTPWVPLVAVATLVVFTLFIVHRLLDGSRPPCACFGSRSTRPLGPRHVVRNLVFLVLAVAALVGA